MRRRMYLIRRGRRTHGLDEEQAVRALLARILLQAVEDLERARRGERIRAWPWPDWEADQELATFFNSSWFEHICEHLDLPPEKVRTQCLDGAGARLFALMYDEEVVSDGNEVAGRSAGQVDG